MARKKAQEGYDQDEDLQGFWDKQIQKFLKFSERWHQHAERVYRRYEDDRQDDPILIANNVRANLFYSNVQTLKESLYNSPPKPDVKLLQQMNYDDQIARVSTMIVQRGLTYQVHCAPDFEGAIKSAILDRLVPGVGQVWVRFDVQTENGIPKAGTEEVFVDNVYWHDFGWSPARSWAKVTWVYRCLHLSADEIKRRYGADALNEIQAYAKANQGSTLTPKEIDEDSYKVYEIWDKSTKRVIHWAKGCQKPLKVIPDPLKLKDFFPCPCPLIANVTTNKFLPVTDYHIAMDQYNQCDVLYQRIAALTKAMRAVGVYDSSYQALQKIFDQPENTLVPVDQWAAYAERGGLAGAVELIPVEKLAGILQQLMQQFQANKELLYEITGMSDIVRGASNQYETAAAQQIKAQFASVRLSAYQRDVAFFVVGTLRIISEVMFQLYSPQKLIRIIGRIPVPDQQYLIPAYQLLQDDFLVSYTVDIEADSLTQADWALEKQQRMEIVQVLGTMIGQMLPVVTEMPQLAPLAIQMIKFAIMGFKGASEMVGFIDQTLNQLMQQQQQGGGEKPPSPEEQKTQAEIQSKQADAQLKQQQGQQKMVIEQQKAQLDMQKGQQEIKIAALKAAIELQKASAEAGIQMNKQWADLMHALNMNEVKLDQAQQQGEQDNA